LAARSAELDLVEVGLAVPHSVWSAAVVLSDGAILLAGLAKAVVLGVSIFASLRRVLSAFLLCPAG
jgi:hypothetical protein